MGSKRLFYRSIVTVEILSEDPLLDGIALRDLRSLYGLTYEECSLHIETTIINEEVDRERMAQLLFEHASEPAFFVESEKGNDLEDDLL